MGLLLPFKNAYVGGLTRLIFDKKISNLKIKINEAYFYTEEDSSAVSDCFTLDFNGFVSGVDLAVNLQYDLPDKGTFSESVIFRKPAHDTAGMGATVIRDNGNIWGVFFKFWLPGAHNVFLRGSFNNWKDVNRLEQLGDTGYWYGFSCDARPGDDYRFFVYGNDGNISEVSDPAARQTLKTSYNGPDAQDANAVITDPGAFNWLHDKAFFNERRDYSKLIIYQAHWGTFLRKGSGDQPFSTFVSGTSELDKRKSVREKLIYIQSLNFNTLELLPIHEANGQSNAGYDPSFFFAVETAYGTPDDLRILVDEAHGLGLAVIFDSVINHLTADEKHSSFSQPFLKGYYTYANAPWSNQNQWGGSDWGPDPNFERPEIRNMLTECMLMYINEYHIDGIRFDATTTIPHDPLKEIISHLRYTGIFLIAEHLTGNPLPYIVGDVGFNAGWYKQAFDKLTSDVLKLPRKGNLNALRDVFESDFDGDSLTAVKYMLGSHDEWWGAHGGNSICGRLGGSENPYVQMKVRLAWAINAASIGIPMMFMGTECLNNNSWDNYNGYGDMDWNPDASSPGAMFARMIQDINKLRNTHTALHQDNVDTFQSHFDEDAGVLAYRRWDSSGGVFLIIINISDNSWATGDYLVNSGVPNSKWDECFNSQWDKYGGGSSVASNKYYHSDSSGKLTDKCITQWSLILLKQCFS
jgi:1,4-alpha-glucan branching enzyme